MLGVTLSLLIATGVYCAVCTRRYEATGVLQVQKEGADALGLDSLMSGGDDPSDALDLNVNLETQASILQSDTLALRTIEELHLENNKDFQRKWSPIAWFTDLISPKATPDLPGATLEDSPKRRQRMLEIFSKHLKVKTLSGTRLIEVDYLNPDPKVAAAVVNTLMQSLTDYNFQTRYNATNQASVWLNSQLGDLRKQAEGLQAQVEDLQKESGVYSFGITDQQGRVEAYSAILDRLQQSTLALQQAEQNRILKEAIAKAAESGNAEMISGLAGNTPGGGSSVNNSLAVIQTLREQEGTQQAALQQAEVKYDSAYPKVAELRGSIAGTEKAIQEETARLKKRAQSDYEIAQQSENTIRAHYEGDKKQADLLNNKAIEYTIVLQEATDSRQLYEDLLKHLKEAGVLAGLRSSNLTVVDPGRTPAKPKYPNVPLFMCGALFGGFFLGCCSGLMADTLDNKINSVPELEELLGAKLLGAMPQFAALRGGGSGRPQDQAAVMALRAPQSTYAEAMRAIRTSLLLARRDNPPKVIQITSSIAGEGKTTFSANLSTIMALQGWRVLVVDTDMRKSTLGQQLGLSSTTGPGLSALLAGHVKEPPVKQVSGSPTLHAILAGQVPPNPAELLDSQSMRSWLNKWREQYDFVVLDSPPILPVTDAVILDSLADLSVMLVRGGTVERTQVERSYHMLRQNGKHYIGVVFNGINAKQDGYYGYYGYRDEAYVNAGGQA